MREERLDVFPHLQYTNSLSLSNEESVIVSPVITVHILGKKGEIRTVSVITRLPVTHWSLGLVDLGKIFLV